MIKKLFQNRLFLSFAFVIVISVGFCYSQKMNNYDKRLWKKNVIFLEGFGSSQIASLQYARIFMLGRIVSLRVEAGITPFFVNEKYQFYTDRCITPIFGGGVYFFPNAFKVGIGCLFLNDFFYTRIPETTFTPGDTAHGGYPGKNYRMRIMPYVVLEAEIKNRWVVRAGYSPIIDPANDLQTTTYFSHWLTVALGYKFGK